MFDGGGGGRVQHPLISQEASKRRQREECKKSQEEHEGMNKEVRRSQVSTPKNSKNASQQIEQLSVHC
jgi:hypothetical protein